MVILRKILDSDGDDELVSVDGKIKYLDMQPITPELEQCMTDLNSPPPIIRMLTEYSNHDDEISIASEYFSEMFLPTFDTPPGRQKVIFPSEGLAFSSREIHHAEATEHSLSPNCFFQTSLNGRLKLLPRSHRSIDSIGSRNHRNPRRDRSFFPDKSALLIVDQFHIISDSDKSLSTTDESFSEHNYWQEMTEINAEANLCKLKGESNREKVVLTSNTLERRGRRQTNHTVGLKEGAKPQVSEASFWEDFHDNLMGWCFSCNYK